MNDNIKKTTLQTFMKQSSDNLQFLLKTDILSSSLERRMRDLYTNSDNTKELLENLSADFNSEFEFKKKC